jgi:hypothetical protein
MLYCAFGLSVPSLPNNRGVALVSADVNASMPPENDQVPLSGPMPVIFTVSAGI